MSLMLRMGGESIAWEKRKEGEVTKERKEGEHGEVRSDGFSAGLCVLCVSALDFTWFVTPPARQGRCAALTKMGDEHGVGRTAAAGERKLLPVG